MSQRFEGRNLEEALGAASAALGVEQYQLTHRVLVEKRGFLGGIKRLVIEVDVDPSAAAPAATGAPVPAVVPDPYAPAPATTPAAAPRGPRRERDGGRQGEGRGRREGRGSRGGSERPPRRNAVAEETTFDIPPQGDESEMAGAVREWCEGLISRAGLDAAVRTTEDEQRIVVKLHGRDVPRFLDRNGELLDAVQVLANKALVGRRLEKDIELDCGDFKDKREGDLERRAREAADRVREGGGEQLLPSMSPIERRIVHIALRDDAFVTTESRGDGFYKRVAVVPRSDTAGNAES